MYMTVTLKQHIEKLMLSGISQRDLAAKVGVSPGTINNILAGIIPTRLTTLQKFAAYLGIDVRELLPDPSFSPTTNPSSKQGSLGKGVRQIPLLADPEATSAETYATTELTGARLFAIRVKGGSMEPMIHEGEIIVVDPDAPCAPNDIVLVKWPDNSFRLQQLRKYGKLVVLHPCNPKYPDKELDERYQIVGRVLRKYLDF